MKRILVLGIPACLAPASIVAAMGEPTIPMADVEGADAMAIADRLLPPEMLATVIEGTVSRVWLPGNVFEANYLTATRPQGQDLCARSRYAVPLRGRTPPAGQPHSGTDLSIGSAEEYLLEAVVDADGEVDAQTCREAQGYIGLGGPDRDAKLSAYRRLVEAMHNARSSKRLDFRIACEPTSDPACRNPRESLANLPMFALFDIDLDSQRYETTGVEGRVRMRQRLPISDGQPYKVTFAFGRSGPDGKSWRVSWQEGEQDPAILLERLYVSYH